MKYLAIMLLLLAFGCASDPDPADAALAESAQDELHIHFQTGFYQDTVILLHGNEIIYQNVLTTGEESGPTDKLSIPKTALTDALHFRVKKGGQTLEGALPANTDPYIGFYLSAGSVVNVYSSETPFVYERKAEQAL
ncbi:hypothetical protein [Cesiribacter andamanensis]|uniref:Uncharacterized protein n=1 Tax=Cesiribacter andamanensis AMV16 TaxID=1279009 RepID=M7MZY3_9BACT|nr:hypothetical protein [Cesiribacter andamanensis]EMR01998.1 hypothetical protein ADICEAN_02857 [Cesiribacter andamanensis AMV16]